MEIEQCSQQGQGDFGTSTSSLHSLHMSMDIPQEVDLNTIVDDYTASQLIMNGSEEEYVTEDDLVLTDPAPSGRSSISSFPASVVHHNITPSQTFPLDSFRTPPRSRTGTPTSYNHHVHKPASPLPTREHLAGFRNPSSVRALQMQDEFSDEDRTPGHRRRGSRMSYISYRSGSAHSTPAKRMSRSLTGSPVKSSKLRKEFPLVLLHCTLLPGLISPKMKAVNEELLEAIIPEPYKKRWKLLQEKVVRNFEVRERGVLLPHPREDYDLLEERLLETLELERSVVVNGHYVGRSESRASTTDSGLGSEENSNRGDAVDKEEEVELEEESRCADCGGHLCGDKRWEVKIFAANGLMKAGAWNAVWSEMEKVDVQVSVWLPEEVRREVEARLDAVIAQEQQLQVEEVLGKTELPKDERTKEIYGDTSERRRQEDIDGLEDNSTIDKDYNRRRPSIAERTNSRRSAQPMSGEIGRRQVSQQHGRAHPVRASSPEAPEFKISTPHVAQTVDLHRAFMKYVQLLLQDQRNIAIFLLSAVLIFYGLNGQRPATTVEFPAQPALANVRETETEYLTTTVFSTSTSTTLEVSTVTETTQLTAFSSLPTTEVVVVEQAENILLVESLAIPGASQVSALGVCDATFGDTFDLQVCPIQETTL